MKKRFLALALVLAAALTLCACQQATSVKKDMQEGEDKLTSVEECSLVLQLSGKPRMELYLDENWNVVKATLDKEELDLTGLNYADAVAAIISEGKLDRSNIQLQVLASANGPLTTEQLLLLQQPVTEDEEAVIPEVDQSVVVAADAGADSFTVEEMANGDLFYDYYSNGSVVRQICYHPDGSYVEWHYKGQWPNLYTTATISVTADGLRREEHFDYDENGQLIYHMQKYSDGSLEENAYYSSGNQKSLRREDADGNAEETQYDENGNCTHHFQRWADGSTGETYYHPNGNPKTTEEHNPNGDYRCRTYAENGVCTEEISRFADGSTREVKYDAAGRLLSDRRTYPNGDWTEQSYDEYGRLRMEEGSLNGEYFFKQYDENGLLLEN
jgi:predicted small secreted protein